jgi:hypothetical protein
MEETGIGGRVPGIGYRVSGIGHRQRLLPNFEPLYPIPNIRNPIPETRNPKPDTRSEEFGDLLFSLVNLARHERIDPEAALREATKKFDRRFRKVEAEVEASEKPFSEFTLDELDAIWDKVKSAESLPS